MSQILINTSLPNDGQGDSIRAAFTNVNANFSELYSAVFAGGGGVGEILPVLTVTANLFSTGNTLIKSDGFTIADSTLTRTAAFDTSIITANTSRVYRLPDADTDLVGHDNTQTLTNKTISGDLNTITGVPLSSAVTGTLALTNGGTGGLLTPAYGGTGLALNTPPANGELLIGNGAGFALGTLTAGSGIAITNLAGSIVIENTGGGGGGGATNSISDGTSSLLISNTSGTLTTTIRGVQTSVANSEVTTNSTSIRLATGTSSRPPLVFPGGSLTTTPQSGAIEFNGTNFYVTISGSRKQLATYDQITAGTVTSFNTRTGAVTLAKSDVENVLTTGANVVGAFRVTGTTTVIGNIYTTNSGGVQGEGANLYTGNVSATGNVIATRNISGATITANTAFVGTLNTNAQPNITSVGTLTSLNVAGNIAAGNISATASLSATDVTATNVTATNITGTISTASQPNITGLGTITSGTWSASTIGTTKGGTGLTSFTSGGALYATSTSALTTGTLPVTAGGTGTTTSTGSGSVVRSAGPTFTGTVVAATINAAIIGNTGANITGATLTGTLQTAAQTNITSVGTLSGLTVSNTVAPSSNASVNLGTTSAWWGNVYAVTFSGVSSSAKYADLAEKYITDQQYVTGTVVSVGGAAEVTACSDGDLAVGVISAAPAYLMNSEASGQAVALKGRVPARVIGPVVKGQRLIATNNGCARAVENSHLDTFAVALETNLAAEEKLVEALVL